MATTNERHDAIRNEGEGFIKQEMDSDQILFLFLGRVYRKFKEGLTLKHIEDAIPKVLDVMTKDEVELFKNVSQEHLSSEGFCLHDGIEVNKDLQSHLKWFMGSAKWEKFETLERDRILEFDKHNDEGVG